MSESENKKLSELRVVDLKAELEKKRVGPKWRKTSVARTAQQVGSILYVLWLAALTDEGLDPETHVFKNIRQEENLNHSVLGLPVEGTEEEKSEKSEEKVQEKPESEESEKTEANSNISEKDTKTEKTEDKEEQKEESKAIEEKEPAPQSKEQKSVIPAKIEEKTSIDCKERRKTSSPCKERRKTVTPAKKEEKPKEQKPKVESGAKKEAMDEDNDGHESPIRLTLEDDDETLHDVENETSPDKTVNRKGGRKMEDKKSVTSEGTSQPEPKSSEQTAEKAAVSPADSKEKETGDTSSSGDKAVDAKIQKKLGVKSYPNIIWISNVAQNTRASELKAALSAFGKVTGAKVVVNAKFPGSCCFGDEKLTILAFDHVRAEQMKAAAAAKSPLKGDKPDRSSSKSKSPGKDGGSKDDGKSEEASAAEGEKKDDNDKDGKNGDGKGDSNERNGRPSRDRSRSSRGHSRNASRTGTFDGDKRRSFSERTSKDRMRRSRSRDRPHPHPDMRGKQEKDVLTFDKIREERERQRIREKERVLREEIRRRHEEAARQREVERRQRSEAHRLEREKEKLRLEREKIEREKAELVRMERERQRLEREKIALEKMELERTLMRLDEERRAAKRPAPYRRDESFDERKRTAPDRHFRGAPTTTQI
ncbi:hypothetical protein NQ318_015808 [Aromia moschata]|uniref:RRM domain-containing protein n=1 Tax=Aromia moschata TaxID=1265417 RepID=A0AAV8YNF1_9CUCU|nr:hypothetical protein NQ318_015808 [Aromia moschata]